MSDYDDIILWLRENVAESNIKYGKLVSVIYLGKSNKLRSSILYSIDRHLEALSCSIGQRRRMTWSSSCVRVSGPGRQPTALQLVTLTRLHVDFYLIYIDTH